MLCVFSQFFWPAAPPPLPPLPRLPPLPPFCPFPLLRLAPLSFAVSRSVLAALADADFSSMSLSELFTSGIDVVLDIVKDKEVGGSIRLVCSQRVCSQRVCVCVVSVQYSRCTVVTVFCRTGSISLFAVSPFFTVFYYLCCQLCTSKYVFMYQRDNRHPSVLKQPRSPVAFYSLATRRHTPPTSNNHTHA